MILLGLDFMLAEFCGSSKDYFLNALSRSRSVGIFIVNEGVGVQVQGHAGGAFIVPRRTSPSLLLA